MKQATVIRMICLLLGGSIQFTSIMAQTTTAYKQEIDNWHKQRVASLVAPNGWVNLEGLFWLSPGKNSFGSDEGNDLVYHNPAFPKQAGYFVWENGIVTWTSNDGIKVSILDSAITSAQIFDETKNAPLLALGSFRWNIIKRDDRIGVRFRNLESPALKKFKGIERFDVQEQWRVTAHLEPVSQSSLLITNVLGQTNAESTPGKLVFTIGNEIYRLDPITEDDQLFILFGDETSGKLTYPSGRFLYANKPDVNGNTILDFNKAYNPPCAFSNYATCPLPPRQNILPIAVTAGEKDYHSEERKH